MALRNDQRSFGLVAIAFHWLVALLAAGLFASGLWMTGLTYYDPWYNTAPWLHKAFGVSLFGLLALRLLWRLVNPVPQPEPGVRPWEQLLATVAHWLMYLLLFAIVAAGYLLSTVDGRSIDVFGLFQIPPLYTGGDNLEDLAGDIHYWLAWALTALVSLHAAAALKHHFVNRDRTLVRMLRPLRDRRPD